MQKQSDQSWLAGCLTRYAKPWDVAVGAQESPPEVMPDMGRAQRPGDKAGRFLTWEAAWKYSWYSAIQIFFQVGLKHLFLYYHEA